MIPLIDAVPDRVILAVARGVPAMGLTLMPDQVILDRALGFPVPESWAVTVIVIVVVVTVIVGDTVRRADEPASSLEIVTVTVAVGSNWNPARTLRTIVPAPMS
ncbi:MAG: hypothetical protein DME26_19960 [Verrucomicrobia bacterium]|nr:MAG: hypothetical protein DME26_19960 [Verrucomicrobiota bacterium]